MKSIKLFIVILSVVFLCTCGFYREQNSFGETIKINILRTSKEEYVFELAEDGTLTAMQLDGYWGDENTGFIPNIIAEEQKKLSTKQCKTLWNKYLKLSGEMTDDNFALHAWTVTITTIDKNIEFSYGKYEEGDAFLSQIIKYSPIELEGIVHSISDH